MSRAAPKVTADAERGFWCEPLNLKAFSHQHVAAWLAACATALPHAGTVFLWNNRQENEWPSFPMPDAFSMRLGQSLSSKSRCEKAFQGETTAICATQTFMSSFC